MGITSMLLMGFCQWFARFQAEKKRSFHVFLKQFLTVFKNWEPDNGGQLPEAASITEYSMRVNDIVVGCSAGHPAEIILTLIEEIGQLTTLVSECKFIYIFCWSCFCLGRQFC